jgi:type IV pilus assembly protein PilY1
MSRFKLLSFITALLTGLAAGLSTQSVAEDTDIYLGGDQPANQQVRPNVLFLLDSSGSMSGLVSGTGLSRLDNMKQAFNTIMDSTTNVNVGLMRFTDPGGPILYPVANIEADTTTIEGASGSSGSATGADIQRRVAVGTDDAEENSSDSSVNLSDPTLTLGALATGATAGIDVRTLADNDDEEQQVSTGTMLSGGSQFDMTNNQINGVRFQVPDIPQGAQIVSASIEWTARQANSGGVVITWRGQAIDNAPAFTTTNSNISSRAVTTASVNWSPPAFQTNNNYQTTNLASVVQEIVCRGVTVATTGCPTPPYTSDSGGWAPNNYMAFIETHDGSGNSRRGYTHNGASLAGNSNYRPRLLITYATPAAAAGDNIVGLRFTDVGVPQGATVTSAYIEFIAATNSSDPTASFLVEGQLSDDAPTFAGAAGNISGRTATTANVTWNAASGMTEWTTSSPYQTPDLTGIVQELVNQPTWCGNNAMAFRLSKIAGAADSRVAWASETSPSLAPVLRINWDETSVPVGAGCINQIIQAQVAQSSDDAEQTISTGGVSVTGQQLDMNASQINGLRFQAINIPKDSTILEARLQLKVRDTDSGAATFTWKGEKPLDGDADAFIAANNNISVRPTTTASVTETADPWDQVGAVETSANLASIIQEIVSDANWQAGNSLAFIQTATGTRRARTFNHAAADAPRLTIKVQWGGTIIPPLIKTVRERLKELADTITADGFTPLVGQYYEAAQYYKGGPVFHGARRSHRDTEKPVTRLSHPASYTGGTYTDPGTACPPQNLNDPACWDETITGSPVYTSPIDVGCQSSYIILLTDGFANHNDTEELQDHGVSLAQNLLATATGNTNVTLGGSTIDYSQCTTGDTNELCGRELAAFMANQDLDPGKPGQQSVKTYTIGFNFSSQYLKDVANLGGGTFYEANNAGQLVQVFQAILADILNKPTSFAAPALTVNAFNQLFNRNEVYFALFEPSNQQRWDGNIKKYFLCDQINFTGCTTGELIDANGNPATGADARILDTSRSIWSTVDDGPDVQKGGAASVNFPDGGTEYQTRTVLTYTDAAAPSNVSLDVAAHRVLDSNAAVTKALLGDATMTDLERTTLINWIRGQDVDNEDEDVSGGAPFIAENRFASGASLHGSPVAIPYGGTVADPVDKVFVAGSTGLYMLNASTGEEEWIFIPPAILAQQADARANVAGSPIYGLDLTPTRWINDTNGDGVIDPTDGDFVRLFVGMRRGGSNYYALDVTPNNAITSSATAIGQVNPELMWQIEGGVGDFVFLGQTWSPPEFGVISMTEGGSLVNKAVLIFGGGHDPALDNSYGTSTTGNAIYIVDALTGALLTSIGGDVSHDVTVAAMDAPVVTQLVVFDSNGDGLDDRIYFGDIAGNVWRVDLQLGFTASDTGGDVAIVGQLADISVSAGAAVGPLDAETRSFYASAAVVPVRDTVYSDESDYDYVLIQSGNRPDPLDQNVHNTFYAFRDFEIGDLTDSDGDGLADAGTYPTLTRADLFDATGNPFQTNADGSAANQAAFDAALPLLRAANGWFIDLKETDGTYIGEKGLSRPLVFFGRLFFNTFIPDTSGLDVCELSAGSTRLYGLNVLSGAALFADWNTDDGTTDPTTADRYFDTGGGIGSDPLMYFPPPSGGQGGPQLLQSQGDALQPFDPGVDTPRRRTYWFEQ